MTERHHSHNYWRRKTASLSRWLHIYLSMVSFAIVFFFAVTGITLNHTEWFSGQERIAQLKGQVETQWVKAEDAAVNKLAVVEHLRATHGVKGALSDFRLDEAQAAVSFKGPGYAADAFITRETGAYELTETRHGFVAVLNDLHKGRDTGRVWSWVIDISAALMTFVSLTGMVLIYFVKKHRFNGLLLAALGALVSYLIYRLWIP
ncbi:MAG: peptidase [Acidobacteria bacterium]|nr:peptidase [Acidobacteriota bacterium]